MTTYLKHSASGTIVERVATNGLETVALFDDGRRAPIRVCAPACAFSGPIDPTPWLPALLADLEAQEGANHRASLR